VGVEFDENYLFCGLAPLWGAVMTNDFSGGLRGLRPPATFLQPSGLRWETNNWRSGLTPVFLYHLISRSHFRGAPQQALMETVETVSKEYIKRLPPG